MGKSLVHDYTALAIASVIIHITHFSNASYFKHQIMLVSIRHKNAP